MQQERHPARQGMTLIEVLVVLSVVGLLAALVLPGVQSLRESQRKQQCAAHLIEIGRALQAFEGTYQVYPAAMATVTKVAFQSGAADARWIAPHVRLLPYLDQAVLYESMDLSPSRSFLPPYDVSIATDAGGKKTILSTDQMRLPIFMCPSDGPTQPGKTNNNYRVNIGRGPGAAFKAATSVADPAMVLGNGAFALGHSLTTGDFKDGMEHTIAFSERTRGNGDPDQYSRTRDIFYSGLTGLYPNGGITLDMLKKVCGAVEETTEFYPYSGGSWFYAGYDQTWYNHALPPNNAIPDCAETSLSRNSGPKTLYALMGARSGHAVGVNCVFMDGHIGFISNTIDTSVWWALASRAGAETNDFAAR
jgi:prepilin-type N-terminal cleavage/methylation domain-containing protein